MPAFPNFSVSPSSQSFSQPSSLTGCLGVAMGNSHLHWGWFAPELVLAWNTPHLSSSQVAQLIASGFDFRRVGVETVTNLRQHSRNQDSHVWELIGQLAASHSQPLPLWIASVVPEQTYLWQSYPGTRVLTLQDVPLSQTYATLGIDRALAVWGGWYLYQSAVLVVDAGTALTFTGASQEGTLIGGAIFPGFGLQGKALSQQTAALPAIQIHFDGSQPPRWATHTDDAIRSGVFYATVAGVKDFLQAWWQDFPQSQVVVTGGDATLLYQTLAADCPDKSHAISYLPYLVLQSLGWLVMPKAL
ncbi:pantothenate kinase [Geitlerinema sp. PCC 9228]|uniref:pantothenate kinase n=1 Tax=Geitlerinema sp. PCC 9228 TaxID=111611 RepID=UPI0014801DE6|nr:pantothenate kinase [Geitlerinema sp. PCC 9228]